MALERLRVMTVFGTRPEAIKLAPVVRRLAEAPWVDSLVVVTGQHREMLDQVLEIFAIQPDVDLDLMQHGRALPELAAVTLQATAEVIRRWRPDLLLVQGDTTSAFTSALAAFYEQVPVGHVEAGLRSFDRFHPFPEEVNRRLVSVVTDLHFAPTERARHNLLAEGVRSERIFVTGNTVVDALLMTVNSPRFKAMLPARPRLGPESRLILVTLHRRESWGEPLLGMCNSLRRVLELFPDVELLFPMHRNPVVRESVLAALGRHPRAQLTEPLDYLSFVQAMRQCHIIVTDSGGIQEEAPALAKPVLVLRETTERPEAIEAGTARLIGTSSERVLAAVVELLTEPGAYASMARAASPFGNGRAAEQIVATIRTWAIERDGRRRPATVATQAS